MALAVLPRTHDITAKIIGAAIEVHRTLGPGLLESVCLAGLMYELPKVGLHFETQKGIPVFYKDVQLDCGFRVDLIVAGAVVVDVKSVAALAPIHRAQVLTYLKLTGCKVGLLINFKGLTRVLRS